MERPNRRRRGPVEVVVVEDSLVQRAHLVRVLEAGGSIRVIGEAAGGAEAVEVIERLRPDVATLDLEIPDGGGQYVIEQVMGHCPTPILVLSATITTRSSARAVEALVAGAVDALPKPGRWNAEEEERIRAAVTALRGIPVLRHPRGRLNGPGATRRNGGHITGAASSPDTAGTTASTTAATTASTTASTTDAAAAARGSASRVVGIAASTGGPPALATVLSGLAGLRSPVLVVQHLHDDFVEGLVEWMARTSALPVKLAVDGEPILPATVYIGPGGRHLKVGPGRRIELSAAPDTIHRPSADELFRSMAAQVGSVGVGVILTGMGSDGEAGLLDMYRRGATTIGQDAATCAVYGMPRAAARAGALTTVAPLGEIAGEIIRSCVGVMA